MKGSTHSLIGVAVGAGIAAYGIWQGDNAFLLALVTAPAAAMLPDIDHNGTKLGRFRKVFMRVLVPVLCLLAVVGGVWLVHEHLLGNTLALAFLALGALFTVLLLLHIRQTKRFKKFVWFLSVHRGFTHTFVIPTVALVATLFIDERYISILLYGFFAGYMSHILSDCFTVQGCPIFYPVTRERVSFKRG